MSESFQNNKLPVYCPGCISFGVDCDPDEEDYALPCDRFEPVESEYLWRMLKEVFK